MTRYGTRLKDIGKAITPPALVWLLTRLRTGRGRDAFGLAGNFAEWDDALAASDGYDARTILDKTRVALMKVKDGHAVYERDSVLFDEMPYSYPVLAGLMWGAARNGGVLNVLDFGGSLGSTFFQNRAFLSALTNVQWNIVEQPSYVEAGKAWFQDERLRFYQTIAECVTEGRPNVVLLSSVLQYLERPYDTFDELLGLSCDCILIDRTPFWNGKADRLCVQTTPSSIYRASYPSWIFSRQRFDEHLHDDWTIIETHDNADKIPGPVDLAYQGMLIVRRDDKT